MASEHPHAEVDIVDKSDMEALGASPPSGSRRLPPCLERVRRGTPPPFTRSDERVDQSLQDLRGSGLDLDRGAVVRGGLRLVQRLGVRPADEGVGIDVLDRGARQLASAATDLGFLR